MWLLDRMAGETATEERKDDSCARVARASQTAPRAVGAPTRRRDSDDAGTNTSVEGSIRTSSAVTHGTFTDPVVSDTAGVDHGDPFVLRYLDEYFLYHTTNDGDCGISVHRSRDLVNWTFAGFALEGGGDDHWAQTDLWAPEVMYWRGVFYMYVAGTVFQPNSREGDNTRRRQGVARADHPLGPFTLEPEPLVRDSYSIDGHPFQDEDGTLWLFYNVRGDQISTHGLPASGNVVDRLITPTRLEGRPRPVSFPDARWEASLDGSQYWNEGSWVLKRRGRYFQLYSGGHYGDASYGIGMTCADAPGGPWTKNPANPIFASGERITGPGHHSVILAPDGVSYYAVYHGYDGAQRGRKVHLDPVRWCGDGPVIGTHPANGRPTEGPQLMPPEPVHDSGVPWWHADLWARGRRLSIAGTPVELPDETRPSRVRVNQSDSGLRVWVDGRLAAQDPGRHDADFGCDGDILASSVTSHLEDEAIRWLAPGERHAWSWGGAGPLELWVAVRGSANVSAGEAQTEVTSPPDAYALAHLASTDGAGEIGITGQRTGAHVTDLFVVATR